MSVYREQVLPGKRPVLDTLLDSARAGSIKRVICPALGTMCDSVTELHTLLETLEELSVQLVAVEDKFDSQSPLGRVMVYLVSSLNRLERQGATRRVRDGMLELAKTGRWLGGVTPTGYRSVKMTGEQGVSEFALEPLPEEAAVVRRVFAVFLAENSLTAVERQLNKEGLATKNGRKYSRFSIRQLLENPVYMLADSDAYTYFRGLGTELCSPAEQFDGRHGMMVYNKTVQQPGKSVKMRDISQWIVAVGRHEGMIAGADWVQAQKLLDQNKSGSFRKPKSAHALLAGMLYCGECGAYMRPKQTQRVNDDGQPVFVYMCERKEQTKSQDCDNRNVNGNQLDQIVCDQLLGLSPESPVFRELLERSRRAAQPELDRMELDRLEEGKADIEALISDLVFSLVKAIDKTAYDYIIKQIDELHGDKAVLQARIDELTALSGEHKLTKHDIAAMQEILRNFQEGYEALSTEQKRATLRAVLDRAEWDGRSVQVFLHGAGIEPVEIER